ncbi:hypothetical protein ScPMuIL_018942 [Solemya velum]
MFTGVILSDDWRLVFRAEAGKSVSVYNTWINPATETGHDDACQTLQPQTQCSGPYKNAIVDDWNNLNITQVKIELHSGRRRVAYLVFDGTGSDYTNWFSKDRILESSWSDLSQNAVYNYFSLVGHGARTLLISKSYAGCPADMVWFCVMDSQQYNCDWDHHSSYPAFLYSPENTASLFETNRGLAEILAIFVKTQTTP